ncbi:MAG: PKD domain-containing protein [Bacteroidota bacterium]
MKTKQIFLVWLSLVIGNIATAQPPIADFTADTTYGCDSMMLCVNFTDLSLNSPTSWFWDFGNGNTSSSQNPSQCYWSAGAYSVTLIVSNAFGSDTLTKLNYIILSLALTVNTTNATCGNCDGDATVSVSGGTPPYTYSWSNGSTMQATTALCAGTYNVIVSDNSGCQGQATGTVTQNGFTANMDNITNENCIGCCDGSLSVNPNGGVTPYTYLWDDSLSQTSQTATGLCFGYYCITVTDANGCVAIDCNNISSDTSGCLSVTTTFNNATCGNCDGEVTIVVSGGTPPYTYQWNDPQLQTTQTATGLCAGSYQVSISDSGSCSSTVNVVIHGTLNLTFNTINDCSGMCDGSATVIPSGGTAPYTYYWNSPDTGFTQTITGLCAGIYYGVIVYDAVSCTGGGDVFIDTINCGPNIVSGTVFNDLDTNCLIDSSDNGLPGWVVRADPGPVYALTNSSGIYKLYLDSGNYTISLVDNDPFREQICPFSPATYSVSLGAGPDTVYNYNFGLQTIVFCPDLSVDISTGSVRPCFNTYYTVSYCNDGTLPATNATIEIELDSNISYTSGPGNLISQIGNVLTFDIGTVDPEQCGSFYLYVYVTCDMSLLGSTMCVEAHIYPDSSCFPPDPAWDHSSVSVVGKCAGDSMACFTIYNTGDLGTGDMQGAAEYRVYENNILVYTGTFQLNGSDSTVICWPANSNTIRLEADQRPGHPGNSHPQDNVELCGVPAFITGQITVVPEDDEDNFIEIDCQVAVGSYDPNDKQVKPEGLTDQYRYIDSTDVMEYLIRFQNTGTYYAIKVVIKDTLSDYLDITTIEAGTSSHPYTLDIFESNILQWTFDSIMLPDSNLNEPESHGFVKFKIHQVAGNTKGTVIENKAGIVFDFNEPVITNTVFNTIGNIDSVTCYIEAGFTYQGADQTVNFTSASSNADSYFWDFGDGNTSTEQNPFNTYPDTGTYTVTLTVNNYCGSNTYSQTVTMQSTGIYQSCYNGYQITVYPNPFNSTTTFEVFGTAKPGPLTFELHNILGERVNVMKGISGNKFIVSREGLTDGIYFYKISSLDGLFTAGKLVIN